MMQFYQPSIFKGYPILAGMSMRGNVQDFPPCGFSFRQLPGITDEEFVLHQNALEQKIGRGIGKQVISLKQTHGVTIIPAEMAMDKEGDGLYTHTHIYTIAVSLADCCGILIYDPNNHVIMALHSGWRGAKAQIGPMGMDILSETYGSKPDDLLIWLTPCAGKFSYEVGAEFNQYFQQHVLEMPNGSYFFDLQSSIKQSLLNNGAKNGNIECTEMCTILNHDFHSYRRDGDQGRNVAFITLLGQ